MFYLLSFSLSLAEPVSSQKSCSPRNDTVIAPGKNYVKGDLVNLRSGPSTKDDIITELRLSTVVHVEACLKKETIGNTTGCWHKVQLNQKGKDLTGYLFSSTMANCRIEQDWDNDGVKEHFFSSSNNDQLRVYDPNDAPHVFWYSPELKFDWDNDGVDERFSLFKGDTFRLQLYDPNDSPHIFWLNSNDTFEEEGGEISIFPKIEGRANMVAIDYFFGDFCGGGSRKNYFTYSPQFGIQLALETFSFSDSPAFHYREAQFLEDGSVLVEEKSSEGDEYWEEQEEGVEDVEADIWTKENGKKVLSIVGIMNEYEGENLSPQEMILQESSPSPLVPLCLQEGVFGPCDQKTKDQKLILFSTSNEKLVPILCVPKNKKNYLQSCSSLQMDLSNLYSVEDKRKFSSEKNSWNVAKNSPKFLVWPQQKHKMSVKQSQKRSVTKKVENFIDELAWTRENLEWSFHEFRGKSRISDARGLLILTWNNPESQQRATFTYIVQKDSIIPLKLPYEVRSTGNIHIESVIPTDDSTYLIVDSVQMDSSPTFILSIEKVGDYLSSIVVNIVR